MQCIFIYITSYFFISIIYRLFIYIIYIFIIFLPLYEILIKKIRNVSFLVICN